MIIKSLLLIAYGYYNFVVSTATLNLKLQT